MPFYEKMERSSAKDRGDQSPQRPSSVQLCCRIPSGKPGHRLSIPGRPFSDTVFPSALGSSSHEAGRNPECAEGLLRQPDRIRRPCRSRRAGDFNGKDSGISKPVYPNGRQPDIPGTGNPAQAFQPFSSTLIPLCRWHRRFWKWPIGYAGISGMEIALHKFLLKMPYFPCNRP